MTAARLLAIIEGLAERITRLEEGHFTADCESRVEQVKGQAGVDNPFAICMAQFQDAGKAVFR